MNVGLLTREYPPDVYGGAGVHVEYLARELSRLVSLEVRCFGAPRESEPNGPSVLAFTPWEVLSRAKLRAALEIMSVDLAMIDGLERASIVHSHTWYTNFAGHLARLAYAIPHVMTTHSLEPLRPWKVEQLGAGGYALSWFCERTAIEAADAVIAVSSAMRADITKCYPQIDADRIHVIHNGIDPTEYSPDPDTRVLKDQGIDPNVPYILFVGRITRQKGITHLLDAASHISPRAQIVLCAGAPDTEELAQEVARRVAALREQRQGIVLIEKMLVKRDVIQLLSHATVFCCPSVYEPMGIVNLEAMACETAVVATATGGIPEVVEEGTTGYLVPFEFDDPITRNPRDPEAFALAFAERINNLLGDPGKAKEFGRAGRQRAIQEFSWSAIAQRTVDVYRRLTN